MADVSCHIAGLEKDEFVDDLASNLVDRVRATNRPAGVIWIEYFASDGETLAQIHFLTDNHADEVKSRHPELSKQF